MNDVLLFILGVVVGAGVTLAIVLLHRRWGDRAVRETFTALAAEALDANARRLVEMLDGSGQRLAAASSAQLESKKAMIDQSVAAVAERLERMRQFLQQIESDRKQEFGRLSSSVASLSATTGELHRMLASSQRRGAWGERMAEDVLRLAGLLEHVNYEKQSSQYADGNFRPDFTFLLPNDLKVNMDVKFPLDNYKAFLDADSDGARTSAAEELCQTVRNHVREVAGRGYIAAEVPTVPYVIVFIPSEQILGLVLGVQPGLIDETLKLKVVLCGPLTLYAMLAIMRQAAENFNVMKTADEIIKHLGEFRKQWENYSEEFEKLGERIDAVVKQFDSLRTTRTNKLQRPLDRIDDLRQSRLPGGGDGTGNS